MPKTYSQKDLQSKYEEISSYCHDHMEPVFITKNGEKDLVVMSLEAYENIMERVELYRLIGEGMKDSANGNTRPFKETMEDIRNRRK